MSNLLLSHLVQRFAAGKYEDLATEALAHVLRESASARQAFATFATGLAGRELDVRRITTQAVDAESASRPDLVAHGVDGEVTVLLEAKFDAGLTDNQPHAYLTQTDGLVLVVCPPRRVQPLWPELLRRSEALGPVQERTASGATRTAGTAGAALAVTTWDGLIGHIRAAVAVEEPAMLGNVDQLAGMCQVFESNTFAPFASEELTADTGRRLGQLNALVDDLVSLVLQQPDVDKQGLRATAGAGWYGHYVNLPGGWRGNLQFHADHWSVHAPTPFWFHVWMRGESNPALVERVLAPLWGTANQPVYANGWLVPLVPPTDVDRDAVLHVLFQQALKVLDLICRTDPHGQGAT